MEHRLGKTRKSCKERRGEPLRGQCSVGEYQKDCRLSELRFQDVQGQHGPEIIICKDWQLVLE